MTYHVLSDSRKSDLFISFIVKWIHENLFIIESSRKETWNVFLIS